MKLLNVSAGQVQTVQIGDEPIQTAYLKRPIDEPWLITEDGVEGDKRAVHPDKLYAFAREAFNYWGVQLDIDPDSWPDGFFGENLTLDSLDETDVRVGDVFAVGDEVRLVATGARTPCLKLAWRLKQPRTFQKVFARSRHTGMYLGILQTGRVRPGDKLQRIHHNPDMPSIADVCDFIAGRTPPPLEPLQRLLAYEHLSPANRLLLGAKLEAAERAAVIKENRWRGWRPFRIKQIVEEAPEIRSFYLEPTDNKPLCQPRPGQHVTVQMKSDENETITRTWSLSGFSYAMNDYRITVRRQSGPGSNWLHQARQGREVMLRAPSGNFVIDMGSFRPVVLIAAGIGITPLMAMLQAHLTRKNASQVYLIYGAKCPEMVAFRTALDRLDEEHPQLHVSYIYSQSDAGKRPSGRITFPLLVEELDDLYVTFENGHRVSVPWHESDIYICGPGKLCTDLKDELISHGGNPDRIFTETFTSTLTETTDLDTARVTFARSGVTVPWRADQGQTLLELAEAAGMILDNDCRAGACLTCKVAIRQGETTAEMGDGATLLCIAQPKTETLILDC